MSVHRLPRPGAILFVAALALIALHVIGLRAAASHFTLPGIVLAAVIAIVVVKHVGLLDRLRELLRRHRRGRSE